LVENLDATLKDLCIDQDDIEDIFRIVSKVKNDVLGVAQATEERKNEKQDELKDIIHVKSKVGEGRINSERAPELSLPVCSGNEMPNDEVISDPFVIADRSDSGGSRHPLMDSQSSSMSSDSRKYLWLDELVEREFQSFDGEANTPAGKFLENKLSFTDGSVELNPSQSEMKDPIGGEDDVLDRTNQKDIFRKKRICKTFTISTSDSIMKFN